MALGFLGDLFSSNKDLRAQPAQNMPTFNQMVNQPQVNEALATSQGGLGQQQAFLNALQAQGGIGNQSNVFNQQQALANQLQEQAAGGGPNPAALQLQQATTQNLQNQAGLMASQRGAGSNPALLARQAAGQGAATQQQAAGQAAVMRAQQQLAAQNALMGQQANMGNLATTQVGQQQAGLQQYNQAAQNLQNMLLGAGASQNAQVVGMQGNINAANAGLAQQKTATQGQILGGLINAGGGAAAKMGAAHGGIVGYDAGGIVDIGAPDINQGPKSMMGQFQFSNVKQMSSGGKVSGKAKVPGDSFKNDTVNAKLSPGEVVIPRTKVHDEHKIAAFLNGLLGTSLRAGK